MHMPFVAGIVLFNPDNERIHRSIDAISTQVDLLILVDNGSDNSEFVRGLAKNGKIVLIENDKNYGIAKALNQMCARALYLGYSWILTLDQDSVCPPNLLNEFSKYIENQQLGIICPRFEIDVASIKVINKADTPNKFVDFCITSASLTNLFVWQKVGGFNEWLFIDCVDYDYCMKVRIAGYKIFMVNNLIINHCVGTPTIHKLPFGRKIVLYNHSNFRNYYIVRNNIYFARKYRKEINFSLWIMKFTYFELIKIIFEKDRKGTLISAKKGFMDGVHADLWNEKL